MIECANWVLPTLASSFNRHITVLFLALNYWMSGQNQHFKLGQTIKSIVHAPFRVEQLWMHWVIAFVVVLYTSCSLCSNVQV